MSLLKVVLVTLALSFVTADDSSQFFPTGGCHHFPHCVSCPKNDKGVHSCVECKPLFGLDLTKDPTPCVLCNDLSGCHLCSNTSLCERCMKRSLGPDLNGVATCGLCAPGCADCRQSGSGLCDRCAEGNFLNNKLCSPCLDKCRFCTGFNDCTLCDRGYYKSGGSLASCSACIANCDFCYDGTTCERCFPGFYMKSKTECAPCEQENCAECDLYRCRKCKNGKISDSGSCQCADNCSSCNNSGWGKCDDCRPGYKRTDDKLCVKPGNGHDN